MKILYGRCCGLDVHKETVAACVLIRDAGRVRKEKRIFGAITKELLELADWLESHSVTHVGMESTSVYWKPVWNILEGLVDITLVNRQHFKSVPGRKTDLKDGEWIGDLAAARTFAQEFRAAAAHQGAARSDALPGNAGA